MRSQKPPTGWGVQQHVIDSRAQALPQTLGSHRRTRYRLSITMTIAGKINAKQLEEESTQMAERMSMLFGLNAPEFFDKALFRGFIGVLVEKNVLTTNAEENLLFDEQIPAIADDAKLVLNAELRQAILQVTSLS